MIVPYLWEEKTNKKRGEMDILRRSIAGENGEGIHGIIPYFVIFLIIFIPLIYGLSIAVVNRYQGKEEEAKRTFRTTIIIFIVMVSIFIVGFLLMLNNVI